MDKSLSALCHALKKIIGQLKPQNNALSFLLLTGKINQGKTALLRQSQLQHVMVDAERSADIYYNQQGVIVELGETWLNQSTNPLQHTLKQLNRCHRALKISGLLLCVDVNDLFAAEPSQVAEQIKSHTQLLHRFGQSLGYRIDAGLILTKLDALAGFAEFFQYEHESELKKPLGFSIFSSMQREKLLEAFNSQFEHLIEMLGQQVISKMHPARSSLKRTLIREFPLQLASLRGALQLLILNTSPRFFNLQALYFTSAEQGGVSLDRLNKKIQHEYTLAVQDKYPQSLNYRAYFIDGMLQAFQQQTRRFVPAVTVPHKWLMASLSGAVGISLIWVAHQYLKSSQLLDEASKELLMYETMRGQKNSNAAPALYHLAKASNSLEKISSHIALPTVQLLKTQLQSNTKQNLQGNFLPALLAEIEQHMTDVNASQYDRYQALRIYLMLGDAQKFSQPEVMGWFNQAWNKEAPEQVQKKMSLLKRIGQQPFQPISINAQIVSDVRNYLNALPMSYLYYSLAKHHFPQEKQAIAIPGFTLPQQELPVYLTKAGFQNIISSLPEISRKLHEDNWVLARQDVFDLQTVLQQAYCYEYVSWWQNFMRRSMPVHFQDYQQAREQTLLLHQSGAIPKLIDFIQQQTTPELANSSTLFNQEIASKFTELSLLSQSAIQDLGINLNELQKFLATLSVVNDKGKTAFTLTRSRFLDDTVSNPLSVLYSRAQQLPEPVANWVKQIADDAWFILINDSRQYINQQWQQTVYQNYQYQIAQRYPFDPMQPQEVAIADFERFFARQGILNQFLDYYIKPYLDTSRAQWQPKELNGYVLPIAAENINELIRANVITNMFFPEQSATSKIDFSLQKISLDPIVANLALKVGHTKLYDDQNSESTTHFSWPEADAKLVLNSIEGNHFELNETGPWAFFKILQKVNVLVSEQDSSSLQILFDINGNSGRYLLRTQNQVNPFIPGILNGFTLPEAIV